MMAADNLMDGAMNTAAMAMAVEDMKDAMPGMIRYIQMIGELNAAHFRSLVEHGVPPNEASIIVSYQPPLPGRTPDPDEDIDDPD